MHVHVPDESLLREQLEAERLALRKLEQKLNHEVKQQFSRIAYPTQADWSPPQMLHWRRQKIKCDKLEAQLKQLTRNSQA